MNMTRIEDWLATIPSQSTRKSYINGIKSFEEFYQKEAESLIGKPKEATKAINKFYAWMKGQGYAQNTARVKSNAVVQFLRYFDTPTKIRRDIWQTQIATDHILQISEVRKMYSVADLREKVVLQVFMLGLRARDASRLEWETFDILDQETPVSIVIRTHKEGINAHTFISEEFKELLATYMPNLDKNNKYLLQTARKGYMDEESLNWTLKNLADRANLRTRDKIHWHLGRKLVMRTSAQLGINQWNCKLLVGRSIPRDIETYINGIQLEEDFIKLHNVLCLNPTQTNHETEDLRDALSHIEKENRILKTRIDLLQENLEKEGDKLKEATDEIWMLRADVQPLIDWHKQTKPILQEIRKQKGTQKKEKP